MPVRSQIAFSPNPPEEPCRASRIRKTLEITPTGAAPELRFATRCMVCLFRLPVLPAESVGTICDISSPTSRFSMQNTITTQGQKAIYTFHSVKHHSLL